MDSRLAVLLVVCAFVAGCTGVDGEDLRVLHGPQRNETKAAFETGLARDLASTLGKLGFGCRSGGEIKTLLLSNVAMECRESEKDGTFHNWRSEVLLIGSAPSDAETLLKISTWYTSWVPWSMSVEEFCKISSQVNRVVASHAAERKIISIKARTC
jgi:hypothetical protein